MACCDVIDGAEDQCTTQHSTCAINSCNVWCSKPRLEADPNTECRAVCHGPRLIHNTSQVQLPAATTCQSNSDDHLLSTQHRLATAHSPVQFLELLDGFRHPVFVRLAADAVPQISGKRDQLLELILVAGTAQASQAVVAPHSLHEGTDVCLWCCLARRSSHAASLRTRNKEHALHLISLKMVRLACRLLMS